ncbi:MAG: hypothetical protein CL959_07200 [Euryarchaeota archaeon]|nr:hypothetical protein [Euryarchaeota archaeon]
MNLESVENQHPQDSPEETKPSGYDLYYAPQPRKKQFTEVVQDLKSHPFYKKSKEVLLQRQTVYSISVGLFIIFAFTLIFMIPEPVEPIEGKWMKADGEILNFVGDGEMIHEIQMQTTWTTDGDDLTLISQLNYIDSSQQVSSQLIVQNVQFTMTEDENGMWWHWQSILINDVEQDISESQCALLLRTSVAENTYEYSVVSPSYDDEKPESCTQNA